MCRVDGRGHESISYEMRGIRERKRQSCPLSLKNPSLGSRHDIRAAPTAVDRSPVSARLIRITSSA